jgi:hypothetical protein
MPTASKTTAEKTVGEIADDVAAAKATSRRGTPKARTGRAATAKDAAAASAVVNGTPTAAERKAAAAKAATEAKAKAADEAAKAKAEAEAAEAADHTNLRYLLMRNADFKVHARNCPRIKVDLKGSDYSEPGKLLAVTEREVVEDLWSDQIREHFNTEDFSTISDADLMANFDTIEYHKCVGDLITYVERPKPVTRRDAKQDLARRVAEAIGDMLLHLDGSEMAATIDETERAAITTAWVHHLPTGNDDEGARWWPSSLPKPDRSDWK